MDATLTLRLDATLRRKLQARAAQLGLSEAELVRNTLDREVHPGPLRERATGLRGIVNLPRQQTESMRNRMRSRNWRS